MNTTALSVPALADIRVAADKLLPYVPRSPLIPLDSSGCTGKTFLKLENLQPIGAFKTRPTGNVLLNMDPAKLQDGAYTASSGNAGLGLAWMAKNLNITARVYAPKSAPPEKIAAIGALNAQVILLPDGEWWQAIESGAHQDDPGVYVDAVRNPYALAGNGTVGLEIAEQMPEVETVIVPFGGGGLSCGIAAAVRTVMPKTRIIVAESDAATPLTSALQAGRPVQVPVRPSFITGAGAPSVLREMWPLLRELIDDTIVVPVTDVAKTIRRLCMDTKIVVEGAGAIAVAAAEKIDTGRTVCVVSGGNIDPGLMVAILREEAV